jgi:hypothetical protein
MNKKVTKSFKLIWAIPVSLMMYNLIIHRYNLDFFIYLIVCATILFLLDCAIEKLVRFFKGKV